MEEFRAYWLPDRRTSQRCERTITGQSVIRGLGIGLAEGKASHGIAVLAYVVANLFPEIDSLANAVLSHYVGSVHLDSL